MPFPPNYPPPDDEYGQHQLPETPTYLWQAVTVTVVGVLCCPIGLLGSGFGIAALANSSAIVRKQRKGDVEGALASSRRAKMYCIVGACVLVGAVIFNVIYYVTVA